MAMAGLADVSLVLILAIILALLGVATEIGRRGHRRLAQRSGSDGAKRPIPDHLLSAMLGLLALLLGFTFSMALNRYDARRELVVQEANAIGTTWLRAQLLEEPARGRMGPLLRHYVDMRLAWSRDAARVPDAGLTNRAQEALWSEMGMALRQDSSTQLTRGLMEAMNESFDLASARSASRAAHIPGEVMAVLLACALLTALMLGYVMSDGGHRAATLALLLLLAFALVMIVDLDRPVSGAIQISQQPLADLRASMR